MRKGVSVVELFVVIAILGILTAICGGGVVGTGCFVTTSDREASAESNAMLFAKKMGLDAVGVVCSGVDTPNSQGLGDGYVSCTLSVRNGGMVPILCGYNRVSLSTALYGQNTSCKAANPVNFGSMAPMAPMGGNSDGVVAPNLQ